MDVLLRLDESERNLVALTKKLANDPGSTCSDNRPKRPLDTERSAPGRLERPKEGEEALRKALGLRFASVIPGAYGRF